MLEKKIPAPRLGMQLQGREHLLVCMRPCLLSLIQEQRMEGQMKGGNRGKGGRRERGREEAKSLDMAQWVRVLAADMRT